MNDLRYAIRVLRKSPGFTATALLTLALAIGANAAAFSLIDAVLFKPLPYPEPDRLALVTRVASRDGAVLGEETSHTGAVWEAVRDQASTVDAAALSGLSARVNLVAGGQARLVTPQRVSAGYFRVLGVAPATGREFTEDEDRPGGANVAVLSDRLWRSAFGADPALAGRTMLLKGEPHTIVGIMPPSFRGDAEADLWTPLRASRSGEGSGQNYTIVLRLEPGVGEARASADIAAVADAAMSTRRSAGGVTWTHGVMPLQKGLTSGVRRPLLLLWGAVAMVLLVAAVNLAGLQLARAAQRSREIATRLAIGGDRGAVVRQLLSESLLLAALGGILGIGVGAFLVDGLQSRCGDLVADWSGVTLDRRVLAMTAAVTFGTAVAFGLLPALHATRVDVQASLQAGSTRNVAAGAGGWGRRILVATEVALGVVLLVGAGLLLRTFVHLQTLAPGFDTRNLVTTSASLEDARYADAERIERLFEDSLTQIRALPGVAGAAVSLGLPYERILNMPGRVVGADGSVGDDVQISNLTYVTSGYFETLGLAAVRGRVVGGHDTRTSAPAIVVNQSFVRRYLADRDPIGQRVQVANATREIVGVVGDVQQRGGFNGFGPIDALPLIYVPFAQFPTGGLRLFHTWFAPAWIVRTASPGAAGEAALRRVMAEVDPQLPITTPRPIDAVRGQALARQRLLMVLVGVLAVSALLLAALGIQGLIASGVAERTRELGIRLALGATVPEVVRTAAVPGIILTVAGLTVGFGAAFGAAGLIRSLLWGVEEHDPMTFAAVGATLLAVALIASVTPALKVRRLDPAALLRE